MTPVYVGVGEIVRQRPSSGGSYPCGTAVVKCVWIGFHVRLEEEAIKACVFDVGGSLSSGDIGGI